MLLEDAGAMRDYGRLFSAVLYYYRGDATGECKRHILIYHLQRLHMTFMQELIARLRVALTCIQMQDCLKCTVEIADQNIGP